MAYIKVADYYLLNTGDTGTGVYDFGGATSFEIPNAVSPTIDRTGEIALQTTVAGLTNGALTYFGASAKEYVVALDTLPVTDGYVVSYNATSDKFEMVAASSGGGGLLIEDGTTYSYYMDGENYNAGTAAGTYNLVLGNETMASTTTGYHNIALGYRTLYTLSTGRQNVGIGTSSLYSTNAIGNTGIGDSTGYYNIGNFNLFAGYNAGRGVNATTSNGQYNVCLGYNACEALHTGDYNIAIGDSAMAGNIIYGVTGDDNIAIGKDSLYAIRSGSNNITIGNRSGFSLTTENNNVQIGYQSGYENTGASNVFIGYQAGYQESGSNKLYIENTNSTTPLIYGEFYNDLIKINGSLEITANIDFSGIPTTDPLVAGRLWSNGGVVTVSSGV